MKPSRVEQKRTILQQSLILLIMLLVATMMILSHEPVEGIWIDVFAIVGLVACLYVLFKERSLKNHEASLLDELISKDWAVDNLDNELNAGRFELAQKNYEANELEGRLREISTLYRAIHKVNTEPRDDEVSGTTLRTALELVGGNAGSIMLMDENKRYLSIDASIGIEKKASRLTRRRVGEGVVGWVAEFGKPVRISGEAQDDERIHTLGEFTNRLKCALCVPLKLKNETIGVMILGVAECEADDFNEYHMSLATIFGEHASVAIMYSRMRRSLGYGDLLLAQ